MSKTPLFFKLFMPIGKNLKICVKMPHLQGVQLAICPV